ncbi:MAG: type IV secretory system conjugative DNA transfer family protein [Lachnospiraceae bacterium]|nr:type IV secretory system conjugative DNA transfer family protein [Lachnospiraceae bacterium]
MKMSPSKKVTFLLPYCLSCFFFVRLFELIRLCDYKAGKVILNLTYIYKSFPPMITTQDLIRGMPIGIGIVLYYKWQAGLKMKNTRKGEEYGSARWGNAEDIAPFIDPNPYNNIILSQSERLTMAPKMKVFKNNRNKHVLVYGGSGSGKTFRFVKPNLYQMHSSYVLTDPKGTLLPETGHLFEKAGYRIYVLDTIDMENSMRYNPFAYLNQPKDILTLAETLFKNCKPAEAGQGGDPFFDTAALLWLQCIIGYLYYEAPPEEQSIPVLLEFLEADDVREDDETYKNPVDLIFEELEKKDKRHFAVKQRKKYKKAAGKTAKSILITLGAYLGKFDIPEVLDLVSKDELHFDTYGDPGQKSILYIIISDTDTSYNFIPAILFTQMFNTLCYKADKEMGGKLATPVQFILDEFANIGIIPGFKILISTVRSRLISIMMLLQTKSQLVDVYKEKAAEIIVGNCDTSIFLGGGEKSTLKDLEESLGKETIDLYNESKTYSASQSQGVNYNKTGRSLKDQSEIEQMDRDKCIVKIGGLPPFFSDKYATDSHPRYKYTGDYRKEFIFDFKKYRRRKERRRLQKKTEHITFQKSDVFLSIS